MGTLWIPRIVWEMAWVHYEEVRHEVRRVRDRVGKERHFLVKRRQLRHVYRLVYGNLHIDMRSNVI